MMKPLDVKQHMWHYLTIQPLDYEDVFRICSLFNYHIDEKYGSKRDIEILEIHKDFIWNGLFRITFPNNDSRLMWKYDYKNNIIKPDEVNE